MGWSFTVLFQFNTRAAVLGYWRDVLLPTQLTIRPTSCVTTYLPTYLLQHNFDSRFTQGWPTVVLPLQAHVQPKSASCLDFYFFLFFPWFWWPNFHFYLRFPLLLLFPNQSCVVAITDLTMLDCRSLGCQRGNWEIKLMSMINFTHPVLTCLHKYCNTDKSLQLIHRLLF